MKCSSCDKEAVFADKLKNVFCTKECYFSYTKVTRPLIHYDMSELLEKQQFRNLFYTDENLQMATQTLKVGEKIGEGKDGALPEIHPKATQVIYILSGDARVTIYSEDKTDSIDLDEEQLAIIPPNTFHLIENIGTARLKLLTIYSPAVH